MAEDKKYEASNQDPLPEHATARGAEKRISRILAAFDQAGMERLDRRLLEAEQLRKDFERIGRVSPVDLRRPLGSMMHSRGDNYQVFAYSPREFVKLLVNHSLAPEYIVREKPQTAYLSAYLESLGARSILVERSYLDRDFLDDYAAYYAYCYPTYNRICTRLHFFDSEFRQKHLDDYLAGKETSLSERLLRKSYLGYIVVKPLPQTIIGRTCIKPLRPDEEERFFPCTQRVTANALGVAFEVESLAFQEQDTLAAACATSALWSVFQGSGGLLQHHIPSPIEITKNAAALAPSVVFGDQGLTLELLSQVSLAVTKVKPHVFGVSLDNAEERLFFKTLLYSYLHIVPLILTVNIPEAGGSESWHAVAAVGYRLGLENPESWPETGLRIRASRMDEIYVHDDQVGPFTPMSIRESHLTTEWPGGLAIPGEVLFPLHSMIGVDIREILALLTTFDSWLEILRRNKLLNLEERLEWDIYPILQSDLKKEIAKSDSATAKCRRDVLQKFMSRYLWRSVALCAGKPIFELLFDATDIELHTAFWPIEYRSVLSEHCAVVKHLKKNNPKIMDAVYQYIDRRFIEKLCQT